MKERTNLSEYDISIIVSTRKNLNNGADVAISYLDQKSVISEEGTRMLLASAIALSIKAQAKAGRGKDWELLTDVIKHLESEFASTTSFEDAKSGNCYDNLDKE